MPFEAIYFITPTKESIDRFIADFAQPYNPTYTKAHLFLTSQCPSALFQQIAASEAAQFMGSMKEINIEFLPVESQVLSLDSKSSFHHLYSPANMASMCSITIEHIAEQLATLCASLGEFPIIRYSVHNSLNKRLALQLQSRLHDYKRDNEELSQALMRPRASLIILDRGVDPISPLMHELTYQAMAYDLLPIENDSYIYEFRNQAGAMTSKRVMLNEEDELWPQIRHLHIADTIRTVTSGFRQFVEKNKAASVRDKEHVSMSELSEALKEMPQYQQTVGRFSLHVHLAEQCMELFKSMKIEAIAHVEQDMVMGEDEKGSRIHNPITNVVPILQDPQISVQNKLRVLMLYVIVNNGIKEADLVKLLDHAQIPLTNRAIIDNLRHLGVQVLHDDKGYKKLPKRKERDTTASYVLSRYTPYVKDVMEYAIEGKLSKDGFPFANEEDANAKTVATTSQAHAAEMVVSARTAKPGWADKAREKFPGRDSAPKIDPRAAGPPLIVFYLGGLTYSEMRCAYETTHATRRLVLIGGTSIITPERFLEKLQVLDKPLPVERSEPAWPFAVRDHRAHSDATAPPNRLRGRSLGVDAARAGSQLV